MEHRCLTSSAQRFRYGRSASNRPKPSDLSTARRRPWPGSLNFAMHSQLLIRHPWSHLRPTRCLRKVELRPRSAPRQREPVRDPPPTDNALRSRARVTALLWTRLRHHKGSSSNVGVEETSENTSARSSRTYDSQRCSRGSASRSSRASEYLRSTVSLTYLARPLSQGLFNR